MKSLAKDLLQVAIGILADVQSAYPTMGGVERDKARLSSLCETRGLGLWTLDLPSLDAVLLNGLEVGRLTLGSPLSRAVSPRIRVPVLFRDLWLRVFDISGCLRASPDVNSVLMLRQLFCLGKKIEVECSSQRVKETLSDYHFVETEMRPYSLKWDSDDFSAPDDCRHLRFQRGVSYQSLFGVPGLFDEHRVDPETFEEQERLARRLGIISGVIASRFGEFDPIGRWDSTSSEFLGARYRHGPGAVSDKPEGRFKYRFPAWPDKLSRVFPYDACGTHAVDTVDYPGIQEPPSRLIAVPKTAKGPRLIAAEPTAHQWCQQSLMEFLGRGTDKYFSDYINFRDQKGSQDLALRASIDGSLVTVDLSSASDRLSCWAVERFWRSNYSVLSALQASRTRWVRDDISSPGSFRKLRKFAAMGSAVTFPVQTIFFLGCVLASLDWDNPEECLRRYRGQVKVFGDDIIMPRTGYANLRVLLQYLGLKVNESKSFSEGLFRESCGMDAYKGYNVTPIKPKSLRFDTPASRTAAIAFANNLHVAGFWHGAAAVESTAGASIVKGRAIVGRDVGVEGRTSFCGSNVNHLPRRWNTHLHREEVKVRRHKSSSPREPVNDTAVLLQYFTERPDSTWRKPSMWSSGVQGRVKHREVPDWVALEEFMVV